MHNIAVIPGDGTGPEVIVEALKAMDATGVPYQTIEFGWGGEHYLKTGETLPEGAVDELREFDAILLGAIGHPDVAPGILEKGILLSARFQLDQYINLRPVKLYPNVETPLRDKGPEDIDFTVVRENTEGIYAGMGGILYEGTLQEVSTQVNQTTFHGAARAIRYAFELTRQRNREKLLHLVFKTNVLTFAGATWWRAFNEIGEEYPDIKRDYMHVDAACMWFVKNP
ncbi:MAG TPA: isocitrate/isopropylmalate family dehydrogenase, partial [Chloroflexota bacterium]|nr:isocitrate/isopropylmalate family dehydrogenase [Chloroflexota bacterium]